MIVVKSLNLDKNSKKTSSLERLSAGYKDKFESAMSKYSGLVAERQCIAAGASQIINVLVFKIKVTCC